MSDSQLALDDLDARVQAAIEFFWRTRAAQSKRQGQPSGERDQGSRADVTGGKHIDGFVRLVRDLLVDNGVPLGSIHNDHSVDIPGFFRPEKKWDLLVVNDGHLLAAVEFKSQVGPSFGNNYNNRSEEAVGNAADIMTAYRAGAFAPSPKPWVGYLMLLEEAPGSTRPVRVTESHFRVFDDFRNASYAQRYQVTLTRLLREALYDATCFILTERGNPPNYREPGEELTFRRFAASLLGHAVAAISGG